MAEDECSHSAGLFFFESNRLLLTLYQWTVESTGNGEVRLKGPNNLYLGIEGAPQNGALVLLGRYKQQWKVEPHGSAWK